MKNWDEFIQESLRNNSHYMAELLGRIEYKGVSCYVNEDTIIIQI